jgi:ferric-dicitrate binding protein FerR (iron transport regulator)
VSIERSWRQPPAAFTRQIPRASDSVDDTNTPFRDVESNEFANRALRDWCALSAENRRHYEELVRVWDVTGRADWSMSASGELQLASPPKAECVIQMAQLRRAAAARSRSRVATGAWLATAAAAMLLVSVRVTRMIQPPGTTVGNGLAELVISDSEPTTTTLIDGSIVHLGPHSRLSVARRGGRRDAWLDGRAFLAVARTNKDPFIVRSRAGIARALNARFELVSSSDSIHVRVVEGRVALFAGGVYVDVDAGNEASATSHTAPVVTSFADPDLQLRWMRMVFLFRDTPLISAVGEIGKQYGVRISIADPALRTRTVTGWFDNEPLDTVLGVLCRITDAECIRDDDGGVTIREGQLHAAPVPAQPRARIAARK